MPVAHWIFIGIRWVYEAFGNWVRVILFYALEPTKIIVIKSYNLEHIIHKVMKLFFFTHNAISIILVYYTIVQFIHNNKTYYILVIKILYNVSCTTIIWKSKKCILQQSVWRYYILCASKWNSNISSGFCIFIIITYIKSINNLWTFLKTYWKFY